MVRNVVLHGWSLEFGSGLCVASRIDFVWIIPVSVSAESSAVRSLSPMSLVTPSCRLDYVDLKIVVNDLQLLKHISLHSEATQIF